MASITIQHGAKNLVFAALVTNETGAEFEEQGQWIVISDSPTLEIPRYCFAQAFDPEGQRARQGDSRLDSAWRSLLLNKRGYLRYVDDNEIVIDDEKPQEQQGRPQFLLRFDSAESKEQAEFIAERVHMSLTEFVNAAITASVESYAGAMQAEEDIVP